MGPLVLIPLLLAGVGISLMANKKPPPAPTPAPFPPSPSPVPSSPLPAPPAQGDDYFDTYPGGVKVFKEPYRMAILTYLQVWGVEVAAAPDVTTVKLVPRKSPQDATAFQWVQSMAKTRSVLGVRWLATPDEKLPPGTPKTLRAVAPGEEALWTANPMTSVYAVLVGAQNQGAPVNPPVNPNPAPSPNAGPDVFSELPTGTAEEVRGLMRDTTDPAKLMVMADFLEGKSPAYRKAAEALRARAKELQLEQETKSLEQRQYLVRGGELQSDVAEWYTGDGNRWRELSKTNPQLRPMAFTAPDGKKIEYFSPWNAGDRITLPMGWNISRGPMPMKPRTIPKAA